MDIQVILMQMIQLFLVIALGYFLFKMKLFDVDLNKKLTSILLTVTTPAMIVSSVLLTIAEFYLCKVAAKFVYSKDRTVSYDELEKFDVETFATDREFDEMLDGVFGAQDDDR